MLQVRITLPCLFSVPLECAKTWTETAAQKVKEAAGMSSGEAKGKASEMQGKASEMAGEAKGKAAELKGEAKSKMQ